MSGAGRSSGTSSADWETGQEAPGADLAGPCQHPPLACSLASTPGLGAALGAVLQHLTGPALPGRKCWGWNGSSNGLTLGDHLQPTEWPAAEARPSRFKWLVTMTPRNLGGWVHFYFIAYKAG